MYISAESALIYMDEPTAEGDTIFLNFRVSNQLWLTKNLFLEFSTVHVFPKTSKSF